ncbi:ribonuclease J [Kiloniella laminariae]|uniref:Ribonuclease J n=1 Tax=Kiloniella laminariae TaxID=454162 RepID=A0ABT4LLS1_9PROT|nr:ribonuclease J [Kiloniella laminariae]MCZ4282014.1 ribonuclease J [Kiloniella laminariae]
MSKPVVPKGDELLFLPLGGTGEIGMNLNLYGHDGKWLMVDLGISFADGARLPGVDVIMPDPSFIEDQRENLVGLVLTHAHEDHIGAIPHLWAELRCPIFATPFTKTMVYSKLVEAGLEDQAEITVIPVGGSFKAGPFEVEMISMTHSIPEPSALLITTPAGKVFHSGDWKFDPDPLVGPDFDQKRLESLADENILAMISDSTNVMSSSEVGSESSVRTGLVDVISKQRNRVLVTCFASNVARVASVMKAAQECGRRVVLMGRSMQRIYAAARENGYLLNMPPLLSEEEFSYTPRDEVLILCTGSQGEPRAALTRLARDEFKNVHVDAEDTVIFSSRIIPGNETTIFNIHNTLASKGVKIITDRDAHVHVSGHPGRDEVKKLYQWVKPQISIPVHGEARHLHEHAKLAGECGVKTQIVAQNGDLIRLAPGRPDKVDDVHSGLLAIEGDRLISIDSPIIKSRQKMMYNGAAMITLVIDEDGKLATMPDVSIQGVVDSLDEPDDYKDIVIAVRNGVRLLKKTEMKRDELVREVAIRALRRHCNKVFSKKPVTDVHIVRLTDYFE